ncbi:MAG: hypothetical protein GY737_09090 [Desulfobacteraceae bacterium]|nr:hypothetical protein [Desulfobacteraceae bacterium]
MEKENKTIPGLKTMGEAFKTYPAKNKTRAKNIKRLENPCVIENTLSGFSQMSQ